MSTDIESMVDALNQYFNEQGCVEYVAAQERAGNQCIIRISSTPSSTRLSDETKAPIVAGVELASLAMYEVADGSSYIIDVSDGVSELDVSLFQACLLKTHEQAVLENAAAKNVALHLGDDVERVAALTGDERMQCAARVAALALVEVGLGHMLKEPAPSMSTLGLATAWKNAVTTDTNQGRA